MSFENFSFENRYAFLILGLLFIFLFIKKNNQNYEKLFSIDMLKKIIYGTNKKRLHFIIMVTSFILMVIALARPVIQNRPITVSQNNFSLVVAFDISKSMSCEDIYPSRLAFAKKKFNTLLKNLKDEKVGAIGFSSNSFLIAPITNDYPTLKYLIKNLNPNNISTKGSDIYQALQSAKKLLKKEEKKALIAFTDGTDEDDFSKSINFANENNIKVFVYAIGTPKGGVIKDKDSNVIKDKYGNIVITRLNPSIKELALQTDGAYLEFSSSQNDIEEFTNIIKKSFKNKKQKDVIINTNNELFYFPLALALLLIFSIFIGFKKVKR